MHLPRRVPWTSLAELEKLCGWIFADESDAESKTQARDRLAAWRVSTPLPPALESTHAILSAHLLDLSSASTSSSLPLRQAYALSIVRLVNGLVDPLQQGAYARSIAAIAAQIGLPSWFVEVRHGATHEDLPSLEILREAANQSMRWLLHNYFLPTLNPPNPTAATAIPTSLRPFAPILKEYKALLKLITRDASLRTRRQNDLNKLLRQVERWVGEAKVAAWDGSWGGHADLQDEEKERFAVDRFCERLLDKGGLVPVSKSKRHPAKTPLATEPPNVALWSPLLDHAASHHPSLPQQLVSQICSYLVEGQRPEGEDATYDAALGGWAVWLIHAFEDDEARDGWREDTVATLLAGLGKATEEKRFAKLLVEVLSSPSPHLVAKTSHLLSIVASNGPKASDPWSKSSLSEMHTRLSQIQSLVDAPSTTKAVTAGSARAEAASGIPQGWKMLSENDGWKPCPIGVFLAT
ncbi:hypothetical protein BOTBODRAFT_100449 [Botryobasidium botryosum FD-172 SS1]|uniref:Las1-domain-containing protein n=1 Tax=Botryobasidium botryosum (strain FD-172 SS1) TaxID=930990 RepID=A0A067MXW8_BOTB1|nr:hypothetical protein BOTBODRAFT_100449 [Botryobasidium botryosum FD-172 SS1]